MWEHGLKSESGFSPKLPLVLRYHAPWQKPGSEVRVLRLRDMPKDLSILSMASVRDVPSS